MKIWVTKSYNSHVLRINSSSICVVAQQHDSNVKVILEAVCRNGHEIAFYFEKPERETDHSCLQAYVHACIGRVRPTLGLVYTLIIHRAS